MRIIIETRRRARARWRTRAALALRRVYCRLAGAPVSGFIDGVTVRRVSRLRSAVRGVLPDSLVRNRRMRAMAIGLVFGAIHVVFAMVNIIMGLLTQSVWKLSVGLVVAVLNAGKSYLASDALLDGTSDGGTETIESLRRCRVAGLTLAVVVVLMSGTVVRLVSRGFGDSYSGALIYIYALYALVQVVLALVNLARARHQELVAVKGVRAFNLARVLVSIFALQTVLLSRVKWGSLPLQLSRSVAEGLVGGSVCVTIAALGLWLAHAATVRMGELQAGVRVRMQGIVHQRR